MRRKALIARWVHRRLAGDLLLRRQRCIESAKPRAVARGEGETASCDPQLADPGTAMGQFSRNKPSERVGLPRGASGEYVSFDRGRPKAQASDLVVPAVSGALPDRLHPGRPLSEQF